MPADPTTIPHPLPDQLAELIAQRFRLLAEPTRIKLLDRLRDGPASVHELQEATGTSQQNASKHLGVLHSAGLVQRTRTGNTAQYAIADPSVFILCELVCDSLRDRYSALQAVLPSPQAPVGG
jgi:DNA-binding transcriptional ArsR family regulator